MRLQRFKADTANVNSQFIHFINSHAHLGPGRCRQSFSCVHGLRRTFGTFYIGRRWNDGGEGSKGEKSAIGNWDGGGRTHRYGQTLGQQWGGGGGWNGWPNGAIRGATLNPVIFDQIRKIVIKINNFDKNILTIHLVVSYYYLFQNSIKFFHIVEHVYWKWNQLIIFLIAVESRSRRQFHVKKNFFILHLSKKIVKVK